MICFKSIQYKNFLSTGDTPTRINLEAFRSSLVIGSNGSGKSTMLDALSFALFGKPHRNINKPQLLNSINQKKCEVQVEFSVGSAEYKVVRGIKPNTFEIWLNGKLMNQESHSRDYQKVLETNILKLNHKTFHQVVVLGSSSFVPFMQLSANARREVIEDLLDIGIFTKMNGLVKERNLDLRGKIDGLETKIENLKSRISLQSEHIQELMGIDAQKVEEYESDIQELTQNIIKLNEETAKHTKKYDACWDSALKEIERLSDISKGLSEEQVELKHKAKDIASKAQTYEGKSECHTCGQKIEESFRESRMKELRESAREIQAQTESNKTKGIEVNKEMRAFALLRAALVESKNIIDGNAKTVAGYQNQISKLQSKIQNNSGADVSKAQAALLDDVNTKDELLNQRASEMDAKRYNEVIAEMLKDTGIKTKVIRQYLPVMNRLINSYLGVLDFFVSFQLDEAFNETIRSRHRDNFAYASFSEGEKQRIDLALLFAWRQVAKMKNSVNTNLLILDEIFDSSLDTDGVENLQKILKTLDEDTRVFVISHKKDVLEGKFDRKIEFRKPNHFSQMTVSH